MLKIRGFKVQKTTNHKGLNPKHGVIFFVPFFLTNCFLKMCLFKKKKMFLGQNVDNLFKKHVS